MLQSISIIGAGRLGSTLAMAMHRAGLPVTMVASKSYTSAARLAANMPGCVAVTEAAAANADLVFLTVPDDAIGSVANGLVWREGQYVVHCSGATEVSVLAHAQGFGAQIGGFHPLQIFADPAIAIDLLPGTTVGIEAGVALEIVLRDIARTLDMVPILLPEGARAQYHGGTLFMSSFLLSMFHQSAKVWATFGMSERQTLDALLPLATGVVNTAEHQGLAASIAGPISRGDVNVVRAHLAAFDAMDADIAAFYRTLSRMQLVLAEQAGKLSPEQLTSMRAVIDGADSVPAGNASV